MTEKPLLEYEGDILEIITKEVTRNIRLYSLNIYIIKDMLYN